MKVKFISAFILFCIKFSISEGQVDFEVDHVSGTPQILIPIWELRTADLVVPVSITHHGQSLKVDEGAGPAGMGWSLQGGGGVYRTVRGLPDDYSAASPDNRKGWLLNSIASTINAFTPTADDNLAISARMNRTTGILLMDCRMPPILNRIFLCFPRQD